jgi:hypothetical protein
VVIDPGGAVEAIGDRVYRIALALQGRGSAEALGSVALEDRAAERRDGRLPLRAAEIVIPFRRPPSALCAPELDGPSKANPLEPRIRTRSPPGVAVPSGRLASSFGWRDPH